MGGQPRRADQCDAMHYATINGTASRIFFPAAKDMSGARQRIIDYSSKPLSIDTEPAFPGVISPSVSGPGKAFTSASSFSQRFQVLLHRARLFCLVRKSGQQTLGGALR